jgi:hypothetical protein
VVDLREADDAGDGVDADVSAVRAALNLDPDDPLATLAERPPSLQRALAAAARERGRDHPTDGDRRRLRTALDDAVDAVDAADDTIGPLASARRRAAEADADVDRLRERTATLRGRLTEAQARSGSAGGAADSEAAAAVDTLRTEFAEATRTLTEAETERLAAEQALDRAAEIARSTRDSRERRLRLRDALSNRRRAAQRDLARGVYPSFVDAVEALGSEFDSADDGVTTVEPGERPGEYEGDPVVAHAAAIRVAERSDPVVVAVDRVVDPTAARDRLRTSVVLVAPE